jgi:hypothetical protein
VKKIFLSYPGSWVRLISLRLGFRRNFYLWKIQCRTFLRNPNLVEIRVRQATRPKKCLSIVELNCRFIDMHPCLCNILNVFHNVFYKYIINATTTAITTCKKVIWRWSKGGKKNIWESTLYFLNVKKYKKMYWHVRKRWEKESNTVKGAGFIFIEESITKYNYYFEPFKVVKWKSCFILLRSILVLRYCSQIYAPNCPKR